VLGGRHPTGSGRAHGQAGAEPIGRPHHHQSQGETDERAGARRDQATHEHEQASQQGQQDEGLDRVATHRSPPASSRGNVRSGPSGIDRRCVKVPRRRGGVRPHELLGGVAVERADDPARQVRLLVRVAVGVRAAGRRPSPTAPVSGGCLPRQPLAVARYRGFQRLQARSWTTGRRLRTPRGKPPARQTIRSWRTESPNPRVRDEHRQGGPS
jgi:hypothetical protein